MTDCEVERTTCSFIGCTITFPGAGRFCASHKKQFTRRGRVELMTPIGVSVETVPPCRTCGGKEFGIQTLKRPRDGSRYLSRYCVTCRARHSKRWATDNRQASRIASKKWRDNNREEYLRGKRVAHAARRDARRLVA